MNNRFIFLLVAGIFWSLPAVSHHSSKMHYFLDQIVTIEGVVTEFLLVNPHARIFFDVTTPAGETETWMAEGEAASVLKRQGWTNNKLQEGDFIKIVGNPSRDGRDLIEWRSIILSDGSELAGGNGQSDQRAQYFERRRQEEAGRRHEESGGSN